jgi:hypothetical protein
MSRSHGLEDDVRKDLRYDGQVYAVEKKLVKLSDRSELRKRSKRRQ